jgi:hypothetical protein
MGFSLGWFQWRTLPPAPEAVAPATWAVPLGVGDVDPGSVVGRLGRTVPPALEIRAVPLALLAVARAIGPFKFKSDCLNTNLTI